MPEGDIQAPPNRGWVSQHKGLAIGGGLLVAYVGYRFIKSRSTATGGGSPGEATPYTANTAANGYPAYQLANDGTNSAQLAQQLMALQQQISLIQNPQPTKGGTTEPSTATPPATTPPVTVPVTLGPTAAPVAESTPLVKASGPTPVTSWKGRTGW